MASGSDPAADAGLGGLLLRVDHVGIAVVDLAAAVAFHTDVLGLTLLHEEVNDSQDVREAMLAPGRLGGAQVQLLAPASPTSVITRFLARSGPGLHHIAYSVADLEHVTGVLRDQGRRLLYDRSTLGTRGSRINFVHPKDAGGVLVELVEPAT